MSISIAGDSTVPQPELLLEEFIQIQSDNTAIAGSVQRNRIGQKKQATLKFPYLAPADYQNLLSKFTTGSGVYYSNNNSGKTANALFAFSGLPSFTESEYVPGASLFQPFEVKIREQ